MNGRGRPFRFLAIVALAWVGARTAMLWPRVAHVPGLPAVTRALLPAAAAAPTHIAVAAPHAHARWVPNMPAPAVPRPAQPAVAAAPRRLPDPARVQIALLALVRYGNAEALATAPTALLPAQSRPEMLAIAPPAASRWSASGWLALRPGTGIGAAPQAGQLGGSQAGVRVRYLLAPRARVAGFARVSAPLAGKGREAAIGLEWQPLDAPVRLVAEQRFGLDGTKSGPGAGVIAGLEAPLSRGFRLEAYGQAGAIRRGRTEPYADGAARATRALADIGRTRVTLGAGVWGAAQRDAARLDLGPSAAVALPVAGKRVRIALDWRQRVAGDARPGSGLALVLGSDF